MFWKIDPTFCKTMFVQFSYIFLLWSGFPCSVKLLLKFTASHTMHCFKFVANSEACRVDGITLFFGLAGDSFAQNSSHPRLPCRASQYIA